MKKQQQQQQQQQQHKTCAGKELEVPLGTRLCKGVS